MFHLQPTDDEAYLEARDREELEGFYHREHLKEIALLKARAEKAEARVAWLERPVTPEEIEAAAEAICDEWGYEWHGEPGGDQTPDDEPEEDDRPSRRLYRDAAREALTAALKIRIGDAK